MNSPKTVEDLNPDPFKNSMPLLKTWKYVKYIDCKIINLYKHKKARECVEFIII